MRKISVIEETLCKNKFIDKLYLCMIPDYFCKTWETRGKEEEYAHRNSLISLDETLKFLALISTGSDIC